ncbi:MAG TPA: SRPBCC domain-containing protein [Acidimicrobiales bacterium]|nr:SRPBCC domain-containing protein [Acidimicrobiales bacterium]
MTATRPGSATFKYGDRTVTMERRFDAPISLVFDALTKPEHISVWFPADDVTLHVCEIDLSVGGKYHYAWYAPGGRECSFRGTFLEIERPTRIVATWLFEGWPDDEAVETVILTEEGGITTMTDILEFKTPDNLGDHFQEHEGAQTSYDKLDVLLADLQGGAPRDRESSG